MYYDVNVGDSEKVSVYYNSCNVVSGNSEVQMFLKKCPFCEQLFWKLFFLLEITEQNLKM